MTAPQTGRIFISYRRDDSAGYAGRIYDRLAAHFGKDAIFMDVDTIAAGLDFVEVLENAVQSCDVLVALIGRQWLSIKDKTGKQRLDNPQDFVRIEVAAALKRSIRVIPVLVDGAPMPNSDQLPDNLETLARRNAVLVNHYSFHNDTNRLIEQLELALEAAEEAKILKAKELKEKESQKKRQTEIENLLSQADIAFDLQDWELTKEKLESVLLLEPDHAQAQVKLDIVKRKLREKKEQNIAKEKAAKEVQKKRQAEIENLLSQINIALDLQGWELAKEKLEAVLVLEPNHAQAQVKLAIVERKLQEIKEKNLAEEKAKQEAVKKDAKEKAEQERKERERLEREEKARIEKEAAEKAAREKAEREATEKSRREKEDSEAAEKIARERAEHETAEDANRDKSYQEPYSPPVTQDTSVEQPAKLKSRNWMVYGAIVLVIVVIISAIGIWVFNSIKNQPAAPVSEEPVATEEPAALEEPEVPVVEPAGSESDCTSEKVFCVGLVTDVGSIDDNSFNQASWEGVQLAIEAGIVDQVQYIETVDSTDYEKNIATFADEGYDVIVTVGFRLAEATVNAAEKYPNTKFIGVDQFLFDVEPANLVRLNFPEDNAGFMVGALAAMMSETGKIGAVCGIDAVPAVWRFGEGYRTGAAYIDPAVEVFVIYHNDVDFEKSFNDPEWGAATANSMIDQGIDVIFGAGGETGNGAVIAAAQRGLYVIGIDIDQYYTLPEAAPRMLSSAIKEISNGVFDLLKLTKDGNFPAGNYFGDTGYAPYHDLVDEIPPDVQAKMDEIYEGLKDGSITTGVEPTGP